jgi:hypothetical protein
MRGAGKGGRFDFEHVDSGVGETNLSLDSGRSMSN